MRWGFRLKKLNYFLSITDQIVPVSVITPPIISVTVGSSTRPFAIKIPPTNVRVCLKIPRICSLDNFIKIVFYGLFSLYKYLKNNKNYFKPTFLDVRVGFEPTMSNLTTSRVQIALGRWCLGDSAPCLITLLTNNDSSTLYSQHRGIVYNLARLTAVWELKFTNSFTS